ncbi:MAG: nucleotide sugar dehydrogenase, partial [Desulfovibrio sp.]|nr:nucleotide sugar dehydrogenase [Desulfovibrio sp.]
MISFEELAEKKRSVAIVGLGYVGLPLAVALSRSFDVIGFDIKPARIDELKAGHDNTNEVSDESLTSCTVHFTSDPSELKKA